MLDLIGFWGSVTTLVALFLFPIIAWIIPPLIRHFVKAITDDVYKAGELADKVFEWDFNRTKLFGVNIGDTWSVVCLIVGVLLWLSGILTTNVPCGTDCERPVEPAFESLVAFVSTISSGLAPYVGELFLFVGLYFLFIFLGKRVYNTYTKVEKVLSKIGEKDA